MKKRSATPKKHFVWEREDRISPGFVGEIRIREGGRSVGLRSGICQIYHESFISREQMLPVFQFLEGIGWDEKDVKRTYRMVRPFYKGESL